jgi:maleate isomerase
LTVRTSPDVLAYYCTTVSFVRGVGGDEDISRRMTDATGLPATTTSTAMLAALRAVGARRVALASPYMPDVEEKLIAFLAGHGIETVNSVALNLPLDHSIVPQADILAAARRADRATADAVFISCTGQRLHAHLDDIEASLGKPVLAANQVTSWHALAIAGWADRWRGPGRALGQVGPRALG